MHSPPAPYAQVNEWAVRDGKPLPRWNTETGLTADTFYRHICDKLDSSYSRWAGHTPVEEATVQSLKLFVLALATGAERYFYYRTNVEPGMAPRMNSMSIYEYDRTLRPHGVVYAIAASLLDPARGAGVREYPSGVTAAYLQRDREAVALLWNTRRAKTTALGLSGLPSGTRLLDTMGNPLPARIAGGRVALAVDRHPVYVIAPGLRAEALATLVARSR